MTARDPTTPTYRAAIIGTGRIGNTYDDEVVDREPPGFYQGDNRHCGLYTILPVNHAEAYQSTPGYVLVTASDRDVEKLRAFGQRRDVSALYPDYRKLLSEEQPDVVSVCTQSPEKAEITIAAAEAGVKAIIVEKAMATSLTEADAMIDACERHGVLLAVNHPNRFSLMNRAAKALIDGGRLGDLGTVTAHAPGGMLHVGTHTFDLMRYWAGDVDEIVAYVPDYEPEKDLPASGMLKFANGATGFFDHIHRARSGCEARGTTGSVSTSSSVGDGWISTIRPMYPDGKRGYPTRLTVEPLDVAVDTLGPTRRMLTELRESLSTGAPFISTGRDGQAALELGLACYASHLAGGAIPLPLRDRTLRVPNR